MPEYLLSHGHAWTTLYATAAAAALVTFFFYARMFRDLGRGRFTLLLTLRLILVGIVILLLFRPIVRYEKEQPARKTILFLLDTSASMGIADAVGPAQGEEPAPRGPGSNR